jgi:hypothetical protein
MADDKIVPFPGSGVANPPSPPDPPDMDARLAAMETRMNGLEGRMDRLGRNMENIDQRLRGVETSIASLSAKTDILVSQVVNKLPSWWQMPAVIGATVVLLMALYSGAQYLRAHGLL